MDLLEVEIVWKNSHNVRTGILGSTKASCGELMTRMGLRGALFWPACMKPRG
jgi:hypothetical protein